ELSRYSCRVHRRRAPQRGEISDETLETAIIRRAFSGWTGQLSAVRSIFTLCPADSGMTKFLVEVPSGTRYLSSTGLKICLPWPKYGIFLPSNPAMRIRYWPG